MIKKYTHLNTPNNPIVYKDQPVKKPKQPQLNNNLDISFQESFRNTSRNMEEEKKAENFSPLFLQSLKKVKIKCEELMKQILVYYIQKLSESIFTLIDSKLDQQQSIQIFFISFAPHQQQYLSLFYQLFKGFYLNNDICSPYRQKTTIDTIQEKKIDDIIKYIKNSEFIYQKHRQKRHFSHEKSEGQLKRTYVSDHFIKFNLEDLYKLEKISTQRAFSMIFPVIQNQETIEASLKKIEKFQFQAFNAKGLFIEFLYRCVNSTTIMAYLPKQTLEIVKIYDYFQFSYQEGCNLLISSILAYNKKCQLLKIPKRNAVKINQLSKTFRQIWSKFLRNNSQIQQQNFLMLLFCILDNNGKYLVNQQKIYAISKLKNPNQRSFSSFYADFLLDLKRKLENNPCLKDFCKIFLEDERTNMISKATTSKQFEFQINNLFKKATISIREQGSLIKWKDLGLFKTSDSAIIEISKKTFSNNIYLLPKLWQFISSRVFVSEQQIFNHFPTQSKDLIKKMIKQLKYQNLIDRNFNHEQTMIRSCLKKEK